MIKKKKEGGFACKRQCYESYCGLNSINLLFGNSTKQKTKNSWGEEKAYKDYYAASDSWFDRHVYQAVVDKKYLDEEA